MYTIVRTRLALGPYDETPRYTGMYRGIIGHHLEHPGVTETVLPWDSLQVPLILWNVVLKLIAGADVFGRCGNRERVSLRRTTLSSSCPVHAFRSCKCEPN
eukprot:scaffold1883_cov261-Pinguiococcus_pyrenoidosus.AAC.7